MKRTVSLLAAAALIVTVLSIGNLGVSPPAVNVSAADDIPFYLDTSLTFEERAAHLVSLMTLDEKLGVLRPEGQSSSGGQFGSNNAAVSRLGVRGFDYWSEALHGVARQGRATSFPYSLAMAATWDPDLVLAMNEATADEARGKNNRDDGNFQGRGLNYFSPTMNLARDPRWGRTHESYSEDPYLTGIIGQAFVAGFQGDDERYEKVNATIKHYAANNSEWDRHTGSADMDVRTLLEFYTRAFKDVLLNVPRTGSVMSAYNRVNNIPCSASYFLLDELLRQRWGFGGFVVSDCGAIEQVFLEGNHGNRWKPAEEYSAAYLASLPKNIAAYTIAGGSRDGRLTPAGGSALSLLAGTDLCCGDAYPSHLRRALANGLITEGDVDVALTRVFTSRFKTGEFDPKEMVPYRAPEYYESAQLESPAHKQLAEDSSDQAIVLLKNESAAGQSAPILPLDKSKKVVMVGEIANHVFLGDYSGSPSAANLSTPAQGVKTVTGKDPYVVAYDFIGDRSFVCNSRELQIKSASDAVLRTIQPSSATELDSCRSEGGSIGFITPGASLKYAGVNLSGATQLTFFTSGSSSDSHHGPIEFRLGSLNGPVLTTVISATTANWSTYAGRDGAFTAEALALIAQNPTQDVYVLYNPTVRAGVITEAQKTEIRNADYVIACIGNFEGDSHENNDRSSTALPRSQGPLVDFLLTLNPNVVVYIQSVNMVDIESFKDNAPAILWTCYNGQAQGNAMARVLFGDRNPCAKLPFTWYADEKQLPPIADYNIRPTEKTGGGFTNGRTYQYFHGDVSFPFGFGLSYTTFAYSNMQISSKAVTPNDTVAVTVDVQNTGIKAGAEIVQLYASAPNHDGLDRPFRQLRGFAKVNLTPGEKKTVSIPLDLSELYFYNNDGKVIYDPGEYIIELAAASDDIRLTDKITLSGARNLTLQSVSAHPGATVLYVDPDDPTDPNRPVTLTADVSAVLVDDTFLNLSGSGVQVTYNSSDPAIASVDGHGLVTGLSFGVCTITATVTYNNSTKSTSFPIVVKPTMKVINSGLAEDALSVSGLIPTDGVLHPNRIENRNHSVFFSALFGLDMRMDYLADIAVFNPVITWGYDNFDPVGNYTVTVDLPNFAGSEAYLFDMQKSSYTKIEAETVGGKVRCAYDLDKNIYLVIALPGVIGNVSLSKKVDINDARMILQYLVDKIQLSPYQLALGDTTGNGKVDINDARNVLQQLIDKIGDFPRIKFEMDY